MKKLKKNRGIQQLKNRYGLMFISPWIFGIIVFFLVPLIQSVVYSFSEMTVTSGGIVTEFLGLDNYKEILLSDVNYLPWLEESIISFFYSLPIILLLSMVLALILNQKFRGRLFFRALYFLPVIIATGGVIKLIFQTTSSDVSNIGISDSFSSGMFSIDDIVIWLDLDSEIAVYIQTVISKIFDLI